MISLIYSLWMKGWFKSQGFPCIKEGLGKKFVKYCHKIVKSGFSWILNGKIEKNIDQKLVKYGQKCIKWTFDGEKGQKMVSFRAKFR